MTKQYFGTDGIRGRVGEAPITPEFMLKLGYAAGKVFAQDKTHTVLIGKDTRISGYMFESALEAGLSAAGVNIGLLGVMPTPGIAYLTQKLNAVAGIVISASHNSYKDNGIKFFSNTGEKLSDETEHAIEAYLKEPIKMVSPEKLGKAHRVYDAQLQYQQFCMESIARQPLHGLKIVLDCANGANYQIAPQLLTTLQAQVVNIHNHPDGLNINAECGSTAPESLKHKVVTEGADIGIAFDGDGDRVIMVDNRGQIVDGDRILYILAKYQKGITGVVGTLMSNLGLEKSLAALNIDFTRTKVGDRYVLESLREKNWQLGGEPSGHILCLNKTSTGDGLIAALQILAIMHATKKSLYELSQDMLFFPQVLINVKINNKEILNDPKIHAAVQQAEKELQSSGRIVLRPSGTEPLVRIMVEGEDKQKITQIAEALAKIVSQ